MPARVDLPQVHSRVHALLVLLVLLGPLVVLVLQLVPLVLLVPLVVLVLQLVPLVLQLVPLVRPAPRHQLFPC